MKRFCGNTNTCNVFAPFYFLFIDQANYMLHLLNYNNRSRIDAYSVQVNAPITKKTLQEKSLIAYVLRFIKVFVTGVLQRFNAQKNDCKSCVALLLSLTINRESCAALQRL